VATPNQSIGQQLVSGRAERAHEIALPYGFRLRFVHRFWIIGAA
jgi:hypothetical protein